MKAASMALALVLACGLAGGAGCASVSPEKREQVERAQQTGTYSYQRIQRMHNAQAVAAARH